MGIRDVFVERFSEDQADRIMGAAEEHKNGIHDNPGSDSFKWALLICISFQCMEKDGYRSHHKITIPWEELKQWIKQYGQLASHNGDVDYLALFAGAYTEFVSPETKPIKCFDCSATAEHYFTSKDGISVCDSCFSKRQEAGRAKEVEQFSSEGVK